MLEVRNITKIYHPGTVTEQRLFENFSLTVEQGQFVSIVGSNGSGKSALARALAGDLTLLSGQRESHFSRVTRLSFEQLQKLVSDEWQRNNTDLLSPGEADTGRTTASSIQA